MTPRERLSAVYHGRLADRVPWAPIISQATLTAYPDDIKAKGITQFTRDIGGDVLYRGSTHTTRYDGVETVREVTGDRRTVECRTRLGTLREVHQGPRIMERRVRTVADYDALRALYESQRFSLDEERYWQAERDVGDSGIVTASIGPTPVQQLLEFDMGVDGFAYNLADHPRETEELMALMHAKNLELYEVVAGSPAEYVMLYENTSTTMISPAIYERYSVEHVKGFVDAMHRRGKVAILHMCGKLNALLPLIKRTGPDAVDTLTPAPTGDVDFLEAVRLWGPKVTIHGVLDPSKWTHRPIDEIERGIEELLAPELLEHPFVLCTAADGLPGIPIRKFEAIGRFVGRYQLPCSS